MLMLFFVLSIEGLMAFQISHTLKHPKQSKMVHFRNALKKPASRETGHIREKEGFHAITPQMELSIQFYEPTQLDSDSEKINNTEKQILSKISQNTLQMNLIQARILSRKGIWPSAKKIYQQQVMKNPQSLDLRADYAEILIEHREYDEAYYEIGYLLKENKENLRALRLKASLYDRMALHRWTFPLYETLLFHSPNDTNIWFEYANQRYLSGQWQKALYGYENVLEHDPDNIYALRGIHSILSNKRPAFKTEFFRYESSDGTIRNHQQYQCRYTLTNRSTLYARHGIISIQPPKQSKAFRGVIEQSDIEMIVDFPPKIRFSGRYQLYQGLGDGISSNALLDYNDLPRIRCQLSWLKHFPWFDPTEAMPHDAFYDDLQLILDKSLPYNLNINTSLQYRTYHLKKINDYGTRFNYHLGFARQIWTKPATTLSITLDNANFTYGSKNKSVPMVLRENVYALSAYIQDQPNMVLSYFLSFGYRLDTERSLAGYYINPGIQYTMSSQCQIDVAYAYSSESTGVVSGSTQSLQMDVNVIF